MGSVGVIRWALLDFSEEIYKFTISVHEEIEVMHFGTDTMALGWNWKETGTENPGTPSTQRFYKGMWSS